MNPVRTTFVVVVAIWSLATLVPAVECLSRACPSSGLNFDYDGVVESVVPGSSAAGESIAVADRFVPPFPRGLSRSPPQPWSFNLLHDGSIRHVIIVPTPSQMNVAEKLRFAARCVSYLIFVVVGSGLLLLRPSAMTWLFFAFCILRRYPDLFFYWPGSSHFYWFNAVIYGSLGGASCALVTMFALRFPMNDLVGWRRPFNAVVSAFAIGLPIAWLCEFLRFDYLGLPSQHLVNLLSHVTSFIYVAAGAVFLVTLFQSRGDERQRLQWIVVFPIVLLLRVAVLNLPTLMPPWVSDVLVALGVLIPLTVAYAVIRRRVFDVQFVISRALVYGTLTTLIAGTFLLIDWFMSAQFSQTRFTLTAEIIFALALGSSLNLLHRNVDRFVDAIFFRQRHLAERRLSKAAVAVTRAETFSAVDRFVVHEPVQALELVSAALFRKSEHGGFVRRLDVGWHDSELRDLTPNDPLVLHLLAESDPVRLADVAWSSDRPPHVANSVLAFPLLLRDQMVGIALYGPHRTGADIDPDEQRALVPLLDRAGAAYDHIDAQALRTKVELLTREREAREREITRLRAEVKRA